MDKPDQNDDAPPTTDDGFHEVADDVQRKNWITAAIIVAFLAAWILFGLRKVLF